MSGVLGLVACLLLALGPNASAQSPEAGLAEAEARAAAAEATVAELEPAAQLAEARLRAAKERSTPVRLEADRAADRVVALEASLRDAHLRAVAEMTKVEEERSDAASDRDSKVASGIGFAIAALILAALALAWGWFRASAAVAYLARIELGQAIGLCIGGGLVAVFIGAGIGSAGGLAEAIGVAIAILGLTLPVALLLARHSAEVQRGRAKPVLGRERVSVRATQTIAALFSLLFLVFLGSAVFADEEASGEISSKTRELAEDEEPSSQALVDAKAAATGVGGKSAPLLVAVRRRQADLRAVERRLEAAQGRLSEAEGDAHGFAQRILAIEKREVRELEREEREAARQAEIEQREAEEAEEESAELAGCDPNYEGECLTPGIGDYDCSGGSGDGPNYVYSSVAVVGEDVYGLDANSNGIGCE